MSRIAAMRAELPLFLQGRLAPRWLALAAAPVIVTRAKISPRGARDHQEI
jgi:hypothetical protein